jgi:hypothetical protein
MVRAFRVLSWIVYFSMKESHTFQQLAAHFATTQAKKILRGCPRFLQARRLRSQRYP